MLNHMAKEIQTLIYSLYLFRFAPCLSVNSNGFQYFLITIHLKAAGFSFNCLPVLA